MQVQPLSADDAAAVAQPQPGGGKDFDMRRYQLARLLPVLRALGFDGPPQFSSLEGQPFQVSVGYNVTDTAFFTGAKAQLYNSDCYGVTSKREGVLQLWTWHGSPAGGECKRVAAALTAAGIPARATTYKKVAVVAYHAGDWLEASSEHYEACRAARHAVAQEA